MTAGSHTVQLVGSLGAVRAETVEVVEDSSAVIEDGTVDPCVGSAAVVVVEVMVVVAVAGVVRGGSGEHVVEFTGHGEVGISDAGIPLPLSSRLQFVVSTGTSVSNEQIPFNPPMPAPSPGAHTP